MLGMILSGLTDAASAEDTLTAFGNPGLVERVRLDAAAEGVAVGARVATKIRHMLDHAGEDIWLELLGRMSGSPQPGAAALEAMLSYAFPDLNATPVSAARNEASHG
ncbi:conserved hypothetical protein [Methylocella silvestris BL2]|uniref:Uncharacterized protein n=1 Tax=Methylocella silvestris (strain DSM 15510 / CIP 108128 / LMG 27833 / NCIMB 13906 / BL2) TaxID=395965 RepID=B8EHX3_METSB|nr:hypothetical protein [Methylocella silvestris]ACK50455.1 conserved hypothetical protein [Methylocella silvestris BL2]